MFWVLWFPINHCLRPATSDELDLWAQDMAKDP